MLKLLIFQGAPSDSKWGEHEVDYILFLRKDLDIKPNPNEVERTAFVPISGFIEFQNFLEKNRISFTPWFNLILNSYLMDWWKKVGNLDTIIYYTTIHRL